MEIIVIIEELFAALEKEGLKRIEYKDKDSGVDIRVSRRTNTKKDGSNRKTLRLYAQVNKTGPRTNDLHSTKGMV